jgi:LmbE family N-acetylglucosaminyl deacetylase
MMLKSKVLVIAPHADDEVLGCGGTIAKLGCNGGPVDIAIVTEMCEKRQNECTRAVTRLNANLVASMCRKDQKLNDSDIGELAEEIGNIIESDSYSTVFFPFVGDLNSDHVIVSKAVMIALRSVASVKYALMYPIYETTELAPVRKFSSNCFIGLDWRCIATKILAMSEYKSQSKYQRNEQIITQQASLVGSKVQQQYAEEFELWRHVVSV